MNDSFQNRLREAGWRRPLTPAELEELQGWLSANPEAAADWEAVIALNHAMRRLPEAPVPTNFTARVLAKTAKSSTTPARALGLGRRLWLSFVPRMALAALVVAAGFGIYHRHQVAQRERIARDLATLSDVAAVSDPKIMQDFEAIQRLGQTPPADEELLALLK